MIMNPRPSCRHLFFAWPTSLARCGSGSRHVACADRARLASREPTPPDPRADAGHHGRAVLARDGALRRTGRLFHGVFPRAYRLASREAHPRGDRVESRRPAGDRADDRAGHPGAGPHGGRPAEARHRGHRPEPGLSGAHRLPEGGGRRAPAQSREDRCDPWRIARGGASAVHGEDAAGLRPAGGISRAARCFPRPRHRRPDRAWPHRAGDVWARRPLRRHRASRAADAVPGFRQWQRALRGVGAAHHGTGPGPQG